MGSRRLPGNLASVCPESQRDRKELPMPEVLTAHEAPVLGTG